MRVIDCHCYRTHSLLQLQPGNMLNGDNKILLFFRNHNRNALLSRYRQRNLTGGIERCLKETMVAIKETATFFLAVNRIRRSETKIAGVNAGVSEICILSSW